MKNLAEAQAKMKARINDEKTASNRLPTVGWGRSGLAERQRRRGRPSRIIERPKDFRSLRTEAHSGGEKYREHLLKRKDFIAAKTIVDQEFLSNIPTGKKQPPKGEPWTYFIFALLVTQHRGKKGVEDIRTKYLEVLSADTRQEVDEKLLELITRPGVELEGGL
jgi:hypothetical protein